MPHQRHRATVPKGLATLGLVGALLVGACTRSAPFENRSISEVVDRLEDDGLHVCDVEDAAAAAHAERAWALRVSAVACQDAGAEHGVVLVQEFESSAGRDGDLRHSHHQGRQRPYSGALAFGAFTVRLAGGAPTGVYERFARASRSIHDDAGT